AASPSHGGGGGADPGAPAARARGARRGVPGRMPLREAARQLRVGGAVAGGAVGAGRGGGGGGGDHGLRRDRGSPAPGGARREPLPDRQGVRRRARGA